MTLEEGLQQFERVCGHDEPSVRSSLLDASGVEEAMVLRTCQRYELYAYGPRAHEVLTNLGETLGIDDAGGTCETGERVVDHLFRVACGLESGVLGEDEVLGQVRDAYRHANEAGALGGPLDTIVLKALRVGERARTETAINEGRVSLGSITVDRASEELDELRSSQRLDSSTCSVLVVGAGEVAELVVKAFAHRDCDSIRIANRTLEHAERLAADVGGDAIPLETLGNDHLAAADVVVSATGADDHVLTAGDLVGHELVVFDLANPRDIDPAVGDLEDVGLVRIDEVLGTRDEGLERRERAVPQVEAIVDEERERLGEQLRAERVDDALSQIYSRSHELRETEFDHALDRLERADEPLTAEQRRVMEDFSEALINKLLHPKTAALRQAAATGDREIVEAWLTLFDQESVSDTSRESAEQPSSKL